LIIQINDTEKFLKYLKQNSVSAKRVEGKHNQWELLGSYQKAKLVSEILGTMLKSTTVFKFESIEDLKKHVRVRKKIVESAKNVRFKFGIKDSLGKRKGKLFFQTWMISGTHYKEAIEDLWSANATEYTTGCAYAGMLIFMRGIMSEVTNEELDDLIGDDKAVSDVVWEFATGRHLENQGPGPNKSEYWIPGDWGYIDNTGVNDRNNAIIGENIIYIGNNLFFGHWPTNNPPYKPKALPKWWSNVDDWTANAKPKTSK
jgi:protein-glutamine gamma-glutamyltransferase